MAGFISSLAVSIMFLHSLINFPARLSNVCSNLLVGHAGDVGCPKDWSCPLTVLTMSVAIVTDGVCNLEGHFIRLMREHNNHLPLDQVEPSYGWHKDHLPLDQVEPLHGGHDDHLPLWFSLVW